MKTKKIAEVKQEQCVACGSCITYCPRDAIHIYKGMYAVINPFLCVGCARCKSTCPASVVQMEEVNRG